MTTPEFDATATGSPAELLGIDELIALAEADNAAADHSGQQPPAQAAVDRAEQAYAAQKIGVWELSHENHAAAAEWLRMALDGGVDAVRPLLALCHRQLRVTSSSDLEQINAEPAEGVATATDTLAADKVADTTASADTPLFHSLGGRLVHDKGAQPQIEVAGFMLAAAMLEGVSPAVITDSAYRLADLGYDPETHDADRSVPPRTNTTVVHEAPKCAWARSDLFTLFPGSDVTFTSDRTSPFRLLYSGRCAGEGQEPPATSAERKKILTRWFTGGGRAAGGTRPPREAGSAEVGEEARTSWPHGKLLANLNRQCNDRGIGTADAAERGGPVLRVYTSIDSTTEPAEMRIKIEQQLEGLVELLPGDLRVAGFTAFAIPFDVVLPSQDDDLYWVLTTDVSCRFSQGPYTARVVDGVQEAAAASVVHVKSPRGSRVYGWYANEFGAALALPRSDGREPVRVADPGSTDASNWQGDLNLSNAPVHVDKALANERHMVDGAAIEGVPAEDSESAQDHLIEPGENVILRVDLALC